MEGAIEFSVVIPLYNEADVIALVHRRLEQVMSGLSRSYEIIYVDDASSDSSLAVLRAIQKQSAGVRIISFKERRGQSAALCAGFQAACGAWIITLDADGQNPPEEIAHLYEFYPHFDFITGVRQKRKDSFLRRVSSQIARISRMIVLGDKTHDSGCSLRLFRREIIEALPLFRNFHRFFPFLAKAGGFSVQEVPVEHHERLSGSSKYKTRKRLCEGIIDLWGVFWLKKRLVSYEIKFKS